MSDNNPVPPRGDQNWAKPVDRLKTNEVPQGAINLNVDGRQVSGPLQGFGQLWKKTYTVHLVGCELGPPEVMKVWKENFPKYQIPGNHFWPTSGGVKPGELIFIDTTLPTLPGGPGAIPLATGVMVIYEDETSFTVMTPEGHPEAGWNTFSTYSEESHTVAQVQSYGRSADPIYEFGLRFMGGTRMQEETWHHVLRSLARDLGVTADVVMQKECLDPSIRWSATRNIWKNAGVRTVLYRLSAPLRWLKRTLSRQAA